MVRTFLCHPFTEQKTFTDQYNPSTVCYTADDRVIIASKTGLLFVHNLKSIDCALQRKFSSVGIPIKLLFCDNKQFIVSLEVKLHEYNTEISQQKSVFCQARVYTNFTKSLPNRVPTPLNCEYSNTVQTHTLSRYTDQLVVLDLGTCGIVSDIALCPIKNNIAISSCKKVYIYAFKTLEFPSANADSGKELIDFFKLVEISLTFNIHSIVLASNWIALASKRELRVIQIFLSQPDDNNVYQAEDVSELLDYSQPDHAVNDAENTGELSQHNRNVNESINLDDNFIVWNFNQQNDIPTASISPDRRRSFIRSGGPNQFVFDSQKNIINLSFIQDETPYIDNDTTSKEVIGPLEELVGHPLKSKVSFSTMTPGRNQFYRSATCVTLLYKRFSAHEMSNLGDTDTLHSLQWLPVFVEGSSTNVAVETDELWPWDIFSVTTSMSLLALPLFFSTGKEGYLYDISSGNIRHAATYRYTSDCIAAVHTQTLLYTVNKNGLEAYTSRLYPLAAEYCKTLYKDGHLKDKSFLPHKAIQRYDSKKQTETRAFTDINYFGSYVTIADDGSTNTDLSTYNNSELPALPVYSPYDLNLHCPSLQLDICLVGMYLLQNIHLVGCSTSYIVLLVKGAATKDKLSSSTVIPWSLYVLEKSPVIDLHEELMALIRGNEYTNPSIYHHLASEAQLILRSELISGSNEETDLKPHIKQSALTIADFLARCKESFSDEKIPEYFEMAGLEFQDIIQRYFDEELPKDKKYSFSNGFIEYLNSNMFEQTDLDLDQNRMIVGYNGHGEHENQHDRFYDKKDGSEFVLRIYLKNQPSCLSTVILKSNLKNVSDELAVKFLNKYKKKQEAKGKQVLPVDLLCLSVLYMRLGNPGQVEDILKDVTQKTLQNVCVQNATLLFEDDGKLKPFGQLLKKRFKSTFLAIVISLFDEEKITLDGIMEVYKKRDDTKSFSSPLCKVLETLLNDVSRKKHFVQIIDLLTDQYVLHLIQISKGFSYDGWKNNHGHVPKGNGHFAPRFSWLDKLHPFSGEPACPQDCVANKSNKSGKTDKNNGSSTSSPKSVPNNMNARTDSPNVSSYPRDSSRKDNERVYCPCCCCSEVLLKFQSLLCSRQNKKDLSAKILDKLNEVSFVGKESLLLLCWPKVGLAKESVEYMVRNYPDCILQYAKEMFDWKAQWQVLLQYLLTTLKDNEYGQWNHDQYIEILKGVLLRLSKVYTPSEFLAFLPSDGSIQFFLPYLHECWEYNKSIELKQKFLDTYKNTEQTKS